MTAEQLDELEADLDAALAKRVAEGWTVITGDFGREEERTCCAVTAIFPRSSNEEPTIPKFTHEYGIESESLWSLIYAFDGYDYLASDTDFRVIGQRLRAKYVKP